MYLLGGFLSTYMDTNKKLEFKYLFYFLFLGIIQFTIAYLVSVTKQSLAIRIFVCYCSMHLLNYVL